MPSSSTPATPGSATHAIVTDAAADVPGPERAGIEWLVAPELWCGGGLELPDGGEHSRDLVRMVLGPAAMRVSEPDRDAFAQLYAELSGVDHVWSIHASAQVSRAVASARAAAVTFPNVQVVECAAAGIGVGLLASRVRALTREGHGAEAIAHYLQRQAPNVRYLVVPDRFDPASGQRLVTATLLAGRSLLAGPDGSMGRGKRLRSRRATVGAIEQYLAGHAPADRTIRLAVGHGDAAGAVDPFLDIVERVRPNASIELVGRVGPRLVRQLGTRCVGLALLVE